MQRYNYWAEVELGISEIIGPVTTSDKGDEICETTGQIGNSLFHYSYEIIFRQVY